MPYKYQTHQGQRGDKLVEAGAEGSLHSKIRRISLDAEDTRILLLQFMAEMIRELQTMNVHLAALSGEVVTEV